MKTSTITTVTSKWRAFRNWTAAAVLLSLLLITRNATATAVTNVIYQDSFNRVGLLNGSAPDMVNATGARWLSLAGPTNIITDGSEAALTNVFNGPPYPNSYLPLTIETGHVYTVTAAIFVNTNFGANWMWLGDAVAPGYNVDANNGSVGAAWMLQRSTNGPPNSGFEAFSGLGTANFSPNITNSIPGFVTNSIVLNTATNPTKWNVSWYTNGVYCTNYTYGSVPTANNGTWIQFVGFGASGADGFVRSFSVVDVVLTSTVPIIVEQPNNLTAQVGQTATFWVGATGLPDPTYQWNTINSGGVTNAIAGATNATYTTPPLSSSYNGLNYNVTVSTAAGSVASAPATLTVVAGQPAVFSAVKTPGLTNVVVMFSGPVSPATALNPANYSLNINGAPSGVTVLSASYGSASNNVILTTSTLNPNAGYTLAVQNVQDLFGEAMTTAYVPVLPSGLVFYVRGDSGVKLDGNGNVVQWLDQTTNGNNAVQFFGMSLFTSGLSVPGPQARPNPYTAIGPNNEPAVTFNSGSDNFLTAPFSPSLTINNNMSVYVFANPSTSTPTKDFINETMGNQPGSFDYQLTTAGDQSFLRGYGTGNASVGALGSYPAGTPHLYAVTSLNTGTNSTGAVTNFIQHYIDGVNNTSGTGLGVVANPGDVDCEQPLYIGWRSDHYASAIMNGQIGEIMLFNTALSGADRTNLDNYFGQKYYPFAITQDLPASTTTSNGFSLTYTFAASQGSVHGISFQWQKNGSNIPGATGSTYTTPVLGPGDNGDTFDVVVTLPNGSTTTSTVNTVTVLSQAPYVTLAGIPIWNTNEVVVFFDESAVDPTTATVAANYSLNNGATVLSAAMGDAPNKVILTTSPLTWNANPGFYTLTVANVKDAYGNAVVTASPSVGLYPPTALWIKASVGITSDGNGGVGLWNDLSGYGNNLNGFGGSTDPLPATNNYGDIVVRFAATNYSQMYVPDAPSLEITGDMSVFSVMSYATLAGGTNGEIISKTGSGSHDNIAAPYDYYMGTSGALFYRGNGGGNGNGISYGGYTATNAPSTGVPHIIGVTDAGNTVSDFINGSSAGGGLLSNSYNETNDADAAQAVFIGARGDGVNRLTGDIAEMIVASTGSMSSNDLTSLYYYLSFAHRLPIGTNSYAVITQQPVATTNIGLNATLMVPAGATGNPLVLQWYDTSGLPVTGQTNATLIINNDQASDAYYLVAGNAFGSVTSSVVSVTVVAGLNASLGPPNTTLYVGEPFTLTAQAVGNAPLSYQWYQGAAAIPNATNASYSSTVPPGSTAYSCTVSNAYNGYSSTNAGPATLTGIAIPTNAFSQSVLRDLPVAYWRLNEPAGSLTAYDYVGGYNGTYGAGTTNGLPGVPFAGASGELGAAMDNSLVTGFITTPGVNINTNTVTFVCWANLSTSAETNPCGLVFCRTNSTVAGYQIGGANALCYTWNGDPVTYDYNSGVDVPANAWCFLVMAVTPNNATFYVGNSGSLSTAVQTYTEPVQSFAGGFAIGADPQGSTLPARILQGEMDEVAIFNYTLTPSQVAQLYTAATTGVTGIVNTNPTNIVFSASSGNLTLSWPADHTGWQLQAQTNSLAVGLNTNWVTVGGSTGTNKIVMPINPANGSVFYRLVYTNQ